MKHHGTVRSGCERSGIWGEYVGKAVPSAASRITNTEGVSSNGWGGQASNQKTRKGDEQQRELGRSERSTGAGIQGGHKTKDGRVRPETLDGYTERCGPAGRGSAPADGRRSAGHYNGSPAHFAPAAAAGAATPGGGATGGGTAPCAGAAPAGGRVVRLGGRSRCSNRTCGA